MWFQWSTEAKGLGKAQAELVQRQLMRELQNDPPACPFERVQVSEEEDSVPLEHGSHDECSKDNIQENEGEN